MTVFALVTLEMPMEDCYITERADGHGGLICVTYTGRCWWSETSANATSRLYGCDEARHVLIRAIGLYHATRSSAITHIDLQNDNLSMSRQQYLAEC